MAVAVVLVATLSPEAFIGAVVEQAAELESTAKAVMVLEVRLEALALAALVVAVVAVLLVVVDTAGHTAAAQAVVVTASYTAVDTLTILAAEAVAAQSVSSGVSAVLAERHHSLQQMLALNF